MCRSKRNLGVWAKVNESHAQGHCVGCWAEKSEMSLMETEDWRRGKIFELKKEQRTH